MALKMVLRCSYASSGASSGEFWRFPASFGYYSPRACSICAYVVQIQQLKLILMNTGYQNAQITCKGTIWRAKAHDSPCK